MSKIQQVSDAIVAQGMLPLYFNADQEVTIEILRALYRAGIKAIEYTSRGEAALSNFTKMVEIRNAEMPDLLLGIGTIKNLQQAQEYYEVGADFFISPGFVPEVASFLKSKEVLYSPGCMTPTEIIAAENAGVKFIKLFPGNMLGPDFLSGIKDIFPKLLFMPTRLLQCMTPPFEVHKTANAMKIIGIIKSAILKKIRRISRVLFNGISIDILSCLINAKAYV